MNIRSCHVGDRVFVFSNRYKGRINGESGTIAKVNPMWDNSIGVKIDGLYNHNSESGLWYLSPVELRYASSDESLTFGFYEKVKGNDFANSIKNVIFNDPATIVFWRDGSKTVVKLGPNDIYNPEKGLAMAICKKIMGNDNTFHRVFKEWCHEDEQAEEKTYNPVEEAYLLLVGEMRAANEDPANYIVSTAAIDEAIGHLGEALAE